MGWGIFVTQTQKNNPLKFVIIQASWLCNALSSQQADVHYEVKFWGNQIVLLKISYFIHSLFILIVHYKSLIKFSTQQSHSWDYTYHSITLVYMLHFSKLIYYYPLKWNKDYPLLLRTLKYKCRLQKNQFVPKVILKV